MFQDLHRFVFSDERAGRCLLNRVKEKYLLSTKIPRLHLSFGHNLVGVSTFFTSEQGHVYLLKRYALSLHIRNRKMFKNQVNFVLSQMFQSFFFYIILLLL